MHSILKVEDKDALEILFFVYPSCRWLVLRGFGVCVCVCVCVCVREHQSVRTCVRIHTSALASPPVGSSGGERGVQHRKVCSEPEALRRSVSGAPSSRGFKWEASSEG